MENFTEFSHMLDGTDTGFIIGILGSAVILLVTDIL